MSRRSKLPQMRFHKTNRQAYVHIDGKMVYLGTAKLGDVPAKEFETATRRLSSTGLRASQSTASA